MQTDEQRRHKLVVEEERRKIREREKKDRMEKERIKHQLELDRQETAGVHNRDSVRIRVGVVWGRWRVCIRPLAIMR